MCDSKHKHFTFTLLTVRWCPAAGISYEITTYTSDRSGASTDADVYVVLYGREIASSQKSLAAT